MYNKWPIKKLATPNKNRFSIIKKISPRYPKNIANKITLENVYYFTIKCKDIRINVVINEKNLQGVPEVGRRFAGEIWLQGNTHVVNI